MSRLSRYVSSFVRDKMYGKYLLVTNTLSGGVFMLGGDFVQQKLELYRGKSKQYDWERAGNMFSMGLLFGPMPHFVYKYLDTRWPGTDTRSIAKKLAIDQLTVGPVCIALFFLGINQMEGKELSKSIKELREKFLTVYLVDCVIWIPCQALNFYLVPARYRVLYMDFILIGYDTFLSYIKYRLQDQEPKAEYKQIEDRLEL